MLILELYQGPTISTSGVPSGLETQEILGLLAMFI